MTKHCINHRRVTYDACKHCLGKDIECPEYLESRVEINPSRQGENSRKCLLVRTENERPFPFYDGVENKPSDTYNPLGEIGDIQFLRQHLKHYGERYYEKRLFTTRHETIKCDDVGVI